MMKTVENVLPDLNEIIKEFSKDKRVFSNESQFQFELGTALTQRGYNISFEVLSIDKKEENSKKRKIYTDIVIDLGENKYAAIELKYKSAGKPSKGSESFCKEIGAFRYPDKAGKPQYLFPQGAVNEGLYFFLKDVERLESFVEDKILFNYNSSQKVIAAYSVIIANSKANSSTAYWADQKDKTCEAFSLEDGKEFVPGKKLEWSPDCSASNWDSITLRRNYKCIWNCYYEADDYPIKYMIFEIKK